MDLVNSVSETVVGEERGESRKEDDTRNLLKEKRSSNMTEENDSASREPGNMARRQSSLPERYFWDSTKHGPNLSLVEDQPDTVRRGVARQHTDGARGSVGYNNGRHTFKFTFNDKPWGSHCAIGVCSQQSKMSLKGYQHLFGCDAMSWAWDIPSGCLLHSGQSKQVFSDKINIKVIYMTLDMNRGILYFQPKGMDRFQAFTGLKCGDMLYPCASLVYGMAEVRISLKHSVFPSEKLKKRISKRSSKSMERRESQMDTKENSRSSKEQSDTKDKKRSKEKENERVRDKSRGKEQNKSENEPELENKDKAIERHVSFKMDNNDDSASQKSTNSQDKTPSPSDDRANEDERSQSSSRESVRVTEPLVTRYAEEHQSSLSPVDDPVTSNNKEQSGHTRTVLVEETDDRIEHEEPEEDSKSESENESTTEGNQNSIDDSSTVAPAAAVYSIERSEAPPDEYSEDEDDVAESVDDGPGGDGERGEEDKGLRENMYLKRHITQEHELLTLERDGTFHKEFISERQRTDASRPSTAIPTHREQASSSESESEQENSAIPPPVAYESSNETPTEKEEPAAISSYRNRQFGDEQSDTAQKYWKERVSVTSSELPPLEDEEEPEDAVYMRVSTLKDEDDQYGLHVAHGWDNTAKGGGIQLYPNVPYIAIPIPRFQSRVQAVRSKRSFKSGIHKWHIRELPFYSPNLEMEEDIQCSGIHIGVVNEEYRNFNQGFRIHDLGRFAWSWDSATGEVWEAGKHIPSQDGDQGPQIDLHAGITVTMNFYQHKVTLASGLTVITELKNIRGKKIYPYVLFNQKGLYPVEIKYLEGPEEYCYGVLNELQTKDGQHREERSNYLGLTREISTKSSMVAVQSGINSAPYDWGAVSNGVKVSWGKTLNVGRHRDGAGVHYLAIAESPLYGGRHKLEFETTTIDSFVFGLVSDQFDQSFVASSDPVRNRADSRCMTTLGNNRNSWAWDPRTNSLFHGGGFVGKYPRRDLDINWRDFKRLRMIVDFGHNGYNIVSFRALTEQNAIVELGIAFVNLPAEVWPAIAIPSSDDNEKVKLHMYYVAGPKDFVTDMKSSACTLL